LEVFLSRVINTEGAAKERTRLLRGVVLALRNLIQQTNIDEATRDLAAFIALALEAIAATIDPTVEPWEKRGYWVKADHFRMDWNWTDRLGKALRQAVLNEDWAEVARLSADLAGRVGNVKLPSRHGLGTPWIGSWKRLKETH
jgi:hypothetical protein